MNLKNEQGYLLVLVMIVIVVAAVLGTAFLAVLYSEVQDAQRHEDQVQAYEYARSGVEMALTMIDPVIFSSDDVISYWATEEFVLTGNENDVPIKFTIEENENRDIDIKATGVWGQSEQEVWLRLEKIFGGEGLPFPAPLVSKGPLEIAGAQATIEGTGGEIYDAVTNLSDGDEDVKVRTGDYIGYEIGIAFSDIDFSLFPPPPNVSDVAPKIIDDDGYYKTTPELDPNEALIFCTGSGGNEIFVRIKNFLIDGNRNIEVTGDGVVHLLVEEYFELGGNIVQESEESILAMYFTKDVDLHATEAFHGAGTFNGFVYAPDSKVSIGGNTEITGCVFGKEIVFSGIPEIVHPQIRYDDIFEKFNLAIEGSEVKAINKVWLNP